MPTTQAADEVKLGLTGALNLLKLVSNEQGAIVYQEETMVGGELVNAAAAEQFVDTFTSWHKGGFLTEYVQDGYYNTAKNVDCTTPGEIKPGPRRDGVLDIAATADAALDCYGINGMAMLLADQLYMFYRRENTSTKNEAGSVRVRIYTASTMADAGVAGDEDTMDAGDNTSGGADKGGFTNTMQIVRAIVAGVKVLLVPLGFKFATCEATGGFSAAAIAVKAHGFVYGAGRIFAVQLDSNGQVSITNADINADLTVAGNWTTGVKLPAFDRDGDGAFESVPATVNVETIGGVPFIGTPQGLFALVPGGFPVNFTPQFSSSVPGLGAFAAFRAASGDSIIAGGAGQGNLYLITPGPRLIPIGPSINPLTKIDSSQVMDVWEAPNGDVWAYVSFPLRPASSGLWEVWVGKRQPEGGYAWHPILADFNDIESGPYPSGSGATRAANAAYCPMLPLAWSSATTQGQRLLLGVGHGVGSTKVLCVTGKMFYGLTDQDLGTTIDTYPHEDNATRGLGADYDVPVTWSGGRYSRHDKRAQRHWTALHFKGKNISAGGGVNGGRILIETSVDGGAFSSAAGRGGYLTTNAQTIALDVLAYDLEIKATWQLDGAAGTGATTMRYSPATITEIQYEGRELPRKLVRISFVCEGTLSSQAGGTRQRYQASTLLDTLELLSRTGLKQDFYDPYRPTTVRKVVLLPPQQFQAGAAPGMHIPEGALRVTLLEVPS